MAIGLNEISSKVSRQVSRRGVQAASEQTKRAADAIAHTLEKDSVSLGRSIAKPAADKTFEAAARRMDDLAAKLAKTGNGMDGTVLKEFSSRLERARALHAEGNTPAAFRMLHASEKLGLRNPALQDALKRGQTAEDVLAAFKPVVSKADKTFDAAAGRMTKLSDTLRKTGNGADADVLKDFATRLKRARDLHAEGNTPAAFRMVHASEKLGLRNPEVQAAIQKGHTAEDVIAAFDKPATKPAVKPPVVAKPGHPAAPEPTPVKPSVPTPKPPVKPFVLPGLGLDLSGLLNYLHRLRAMFGLA